MKAIILAGGLGTRLWPYAEIRNKTMAPVANKPLVRWAVEAALAAGMEGVVIAAGPHSEQLANHFQSDAAVKVVQVGNTKGAPFTLAAVRGAVNGSFIVLNGDTLYDPIDIRALADSIPYDPNGICPLTDKLQQGPSVLLAGLAENESHGHICADAREGFLTRIEGHPQEQMPYRVSAYGFTEDFWPFILNSSDLMTDIFVGMMPPLEGFLEMCLADAMRSGRRIQAVVAKGSCPDVNKPWELLKANVTMVKTLCSSLSENILAEGASIDPSAIIEGFVSLGRNSRIGKNALIKGNVICGDNTEITDGAMILGDAVIGSDCSIRQYCQIEGGSVIGNRCVISHCAEFNGVAFDTVYLYHYMEFWGVLGLNTDLGAATVCGTLRFDNGSTTHRVKGRQEHPKEYGNATYLGDFCRTGVNAILMPGVKTGPYSIVGPGVILTGDLPSGKLIMQKQETTLKDWSPDKYGW